MSVAAVTDGFADDRAAVVLTRWLTSVPTMQRGSPEEKKKNQENISKNKRCKTVEAGSLLMSREPMRRRTGRWCHCFQMLLQLFLWRTLVHLKAVSLKTSGRILGLCRHILCFDSCKPSESPSNHLLPARFSCFLLSADFCLLLSCFLESVLSHFHPNPASGRKHPELWMKCNL